MKDVPKLGGPDSLFFRAGLEGSYGSRLSSLSSSQQFPGSASQAGQTKVRGREGVEAESNLIMFSSAEDWQVECNARKNCLGNIQSPTKSQDRCQIQCEPSSSELCKTWKQLI